MRANRLCGLAEAEFIEKYGGSVPVLALRWAQLCFAFYYLDGYRVRGRLRASTRVSRSVSKISKIGTFSG